MLLYAYLSKTKCATNRYDRLYAFASVEAFVNTMDYYKNDYDYYLSPVTHEDAQEIASTAVLARWNSIAGYCEEYGIVNVFDNSMFDIFDGSRHMVYLTERAADEKIPASVKFQYLPEGDRGHDYQH